MQLSLFDLHCDTACEMLAQRQPLGENHLAVSLAQAQDFTQYIQVMALWTDPALDNEAGWQRLRRMHANLLADPAVTQGRARVCGGCPARAPGVSLLLGVEDARVLDGRPERVAELAGLGVRILTPLWSGETCIGGAHDTRAGLTAFGRDALREAMALGMTVDISHASERSADDIFALAADAGRPVIASHSDAYAVCPVSRNLHPGQIRALLCAGGVIGINLYRRFLSRDGEATMEDVRRHIEYFLEQGCAGALCLGCDMDGAELPPDLPSLGALPRLAAYLRGWYPEDLICDLFFENAFRFAHRHLGAPQ